MCCLVVRLSPPGTPSLLPSCFFPPQGFAVSPQLVVVPRTYPMFLYGFPSPASPHTRQSSFPNLESTCFLGTFFFPPLKWFLFHEGRSSISPDRLGLALFPRLLSYRLLRYFLSLSTITSYGFCPSPRLLHLESLFSQTSLTSWKTPPQVILLSHWSVPETFSSPPGVTCTQVLYQKTLPVPLRSPSLPPALRPFFSLLCDSTLLLISVSWKMN